MMKRYLAILLGLVLLALVAPSTLAGKGNGKGKPGGGGGGGGGDPSGTIYFTLGNTGLPDAYTMDADGSNKTALPAGVRGQPSHDLHGGRRWFLDYRGVTGTYPDGRARRELFAVRDDGAATQLTDQADLDLGATYPALFSHVRWTPDDSEISFVARRWNTTAVIEAGIYTAVIDYDLAGEIVGLVAQPGSPLVESGLVDMGGLRGLYPDIGRFDWSPDGSRIVHNTRLTGDYVGLDLTVVDDGVATTVTTTASAGDPVWSPDGSLIAFSDNSIWTIRPDGTDQREVVRRRGGRNWIAYNGPRWSPTGSHLICTGSGNIDDGSQDVYRVAADGGGKTNLTDDVDTRFVGGTPAGAAAWR